MFTIEEHMDHKWYSINRLTGYYQKTRIMVTPFIRPTIDLKYGQYGIVACDGYDLKGSTGEYSLVHLQVPVSIPIPTETLKANILLFFTSPLPPPLYLPVNRAIVNPRPGDILKDKNVPAEGFPMGAEYVNKLLVALASDVEFLKSKGVMDYSLLLFRVGALIDEEHPCKIGYGNGNTYYGGVIDILQKYTAGKRAEHSWKVRGIE
jgi:hypothetical protein